MAKRKVKEEDKRPPTEDTSVKGDDDDQEQVIEVEEPILDVAEQVETVEDELPTGAARGVRIEVARTKPPKSDQWEYYWLLYGPNGVPIATSPDSSRTLNALKKQVRAAAEAIDKAEFVRLY